MDAVVLGIAGIARLPAGSGGGANNGLARTGVRATSVANSRNKFIAGSYQLLSAEMFQPEPLNVTKFVRSVELSGATVMATESRDHLPPLRSDNPTQPRHSGSA